MNHDDDDDFGPDYESWLDEVASGLALPLPDDEWVEWMTLTLTSAEECWGQMQDEEIESRYAATH